jgi:hypothetical protein
MATELNPQSAPAQAPGPHQIVVVGGGAGGLELATRLGDKLGKRGRAQITPDAMRRNPMRTSPSSQLFPSMPIPQGNHAQPAD